MIFLPSWMNSISGESSQGMGASFIMLIPKKTGELSIKDYRPISLIGIYKILAKVLAGRTQKVPPKIISREQELL